MRKLLSFFATFLSLILLFSACNNNVTSQDPTDTVPTLITAEYTPYDLMIWGDAMFTANYYGDILGEFARKDGIALNMIALVYDNQGTNSTYNLYELFNWAGSELNGINTASGNGGKLSRVLNSTDNKVEGFHILLGRDRALNPDNMQASRNILSMSELEKLFKQHNPYGEFAVVTPPAYEDGFKDYDTYKLPSYTHDEHLEKIKEYAQQTMGSLTDSAVQYDWASAQEYVRSNYGDVLTFDWTDDSLRHPSAEATYYYAALSYCWIFDKSPVGMDVYGTIDIETAKALQEIAHKYVFNTDPSTVSREDNTVYVYPEDSRFKDEVISDDVKALVATAKAFYDRGKMIQYDQTKIDSLVGDHTRRDLYIAPEYATPQKLTYLDCSSFVFNCYKDTFNYALAATGTERMVTLSDLYAYYWDDWSDLTDVQAIESFLETIKPGDLIVYRDKKGTWGHALLYAGNGMVYHSTGHKMSGGSSDYNFNDKTEKTELQGTIRYEPIDILTSPFGHHYMFEYGCKVAILRPLEKEDGLKVTESALLRLFNLSNIISYKLTSAQEGITVSPGADVTFTYYLENIGADAKTIEIKETLPSEVTFKSGDFTVENGEIAFSVSVAPYETKQISYTVTVKPDTELLTPIYFDKTTAGGVPMNLTTIYVGKTLTNEQRAAISGYVAESAKTATSSQDLITKVYTALGYDFTCKNPFMTARNVFDIVTGKHFVLSATHDTTLDMIPLNVYGGKGLKSSS